MNVQEEKLNKIAAADNRIVADCMMDACEKEDDGITRKTDQKVVRSCWWIVVDEPFCRRGGGGRQNDRYG